MTLLLELAPDEEALLREKAARRGQPAEEYALTVLRRDFERDVPTPSEDSQEKPVKTVAEMLGNRIGRLSSSQAHNGQQSSTAENTGEEFTKIIVEKYRKQGLDL